MIRDTKEEIICSILRLMQRHFINGQIDIDGKILVILLILTNEKAPLKSSMDGKNLLFCVSSFCTPISILYSGSKDYSQKNASIL